MHILKLSARSDKMGRYIAHEVLENQTVVRRRIAFVHAYTL